MVLGLGRRVVTKKIAETQERLPIVRDTVMLARKLHLPYGRNGVWQSHLKLLDLATELLGDGLVSHPNELLNQAARQLVKEIEQMRNCKPRPKPVYPPGARQITRTRPKTALPRDRLSPVARMEPRQ